MERTVPMPAMLPPLHSQEKDASAARGRDGSAGSLDRSRADRSARGRDRDRTPGGRGGRSDDTARSVNPLLEEFKNSKARRIDMKVCEAPGGGLTGLLPHSCLEQPTLRNSWWLLCDTRA
jgi:hypothetical protein